MRIRLKAYVIYLEEVQKNEMNTTSLSLKHGLDDPNYAQVELRHDPAPML